VLKPDRKIFSNSLVNCKYQKIEAAFLLRQAARKRFNHDTHKYITMKSCPKMI